VWVYSFCESGDIFLVENVFNFNKLSGKKVNLVDNLGGSTIPDTYIS